MYLQHDTHVLLCSSFAKLGCSERTPPTYNGRNLEHMSPAIYRCISQIIIIVIFMMIQMIIQSLFLFAGGMHNYISQLLKV